jgi:hypothetical protein
MQVGIGGLIDDRDALHPNQWVRAGDRYHATRPYSCCLTTPASFSHHHFV